jgi:O-acetyl-ADP-ribose deacetylase (regulator of RNase III)
VNRVTVVEGDITQLDVDAIVNAAAPALLGGGGVDGAIHRAAGPELVAACRALPEVQPRVRCPAGEARITPGFQLRARYVVHTVGPIWRGGSFGEEEQLASCYRSSLSLVREHGLRSVAFPAISCGAFRYPPHQASSIAVGAIGGFLGDDRVVERVLLVAFEPEIASILRLAVSGARA